jgi:hypothetical protein
VALGVLVALGLAIWAGLSIVSLPGGEEPGVASEPPHAEIDERSRERLVEILREDEEAGR